MLKALFAAGAVAMILTSSPAAASLGRGLSLDSSMDVSSAPAGVMTVDFAQGHETVPLNLHQPHRIRMVAESVEAGRYDDFNTLLTLLTVLSAAAVFVAVSLATAARDDRELARAASRREDQQAEQGWKGDVMRALEAELMTFDRGEIRRAA